MHLFYFVLLFTTFYHFHQAKTEDWSHSGGHNDLDGGEEDYTEDDEGSGAQGDKKSFQIGIALPWLSTARHSVASIPKPILVPVYKTGNFICRVALAGNPKVKILGQVGDNKEKTFQLFDTKLFSPYFLAPLSHHEMLDTGYQSRQLLLLLPAEVLSNGSLPLGPL